MKYFILFTTRFISSLIGFLASIRAFQQLNLFIIKTYIKAYNLDLSEVKEPLESFTSLANFFVRELKPSARPIALDGNDIICSPADAELRSSGPVNQSYQVLVKGIEFNWQEFLIRPDVYQEFKSGSFFNFYLSPRDYHHVHFPLAGQVRDFIHHPGSLLPVNNWSISTFPKLFCVNERVLTVVETKSFRYLLVMIGALNVGSIELDFAPAFKRSFFATTTKDYKLHQVYKAETGQRFGSFRLGSSVMCIFPEEAKVQSDLANGSFVKFGERIGKLV